MDEQQKTTYDAPMRDTGCAQSATASNASAAQGTDSQETQDAFAQTANAPGAQSPYGTQTAQSSYSAQTTGNPYANGQASYTQSPYGQSTYGTAQNAYGQTQNPYGTAQNPYAGAQNPYAQNQNPYARPAQPTQNPYASQPYGTGYGQSPYGNAPYGTQNPYGQNGGYTQNPYGNGAQYPYGQQPYYAPRPPQPPYYGQYYAGGYAPLNTPDLQKKRESAAALRKMSLSHGLSVLGLPIIVFVISFILAFVPSFREAVYQDNTPIYIAINAALSLIGIFVPFFLGYLYQKKRGLIKELPLGTPYDSKAAVLLVFVGLMCCIAGSYVTNFLSALAENMFGITFTMPTDETVLDTLPKILLTVLGTAVIPAFVEEFAIRGTVMQPLRRYGDKFAILMSALVFALMHGNMVQIPFAFIAGIAIGYAVTVTGSMWVGVAIHFLNNFAAVMMQVAVDNLPEATANLVILAMIGVIAVVGIACAVIYFKTYKRPTLSDGEGILQRGEKGKNYICTVSMILALLYLLIQTAQYVEF